MKTTIDIPDALMIRAKKRAVELRRPVRELVIEGLEARLDQEVARRPKRKPPTINWVVTEGGAPPNIDVANREELSTLFQRPL